MSKISRRNFLEQSALATAGTLCVPFFLKAWEYTSESFDSSDRKLVIIQFSGGNDGLNTIVPFEDDVYYTSRPTIAIPKKEVIKLSDYQGFHPALAKLKSIYDDGELAIINSVGYPNPNRSHFRSMDIWHTGSDTDEYLSTGWLGRYLDNSCKACTSHQILEVDDAVSLALKGAQYSGFAMSNPARLYKSIHSPLSKAIIQHHHGHDHDENVAYLYKVLARTASSADYLYQQSKIYASSTEYPQTPLGKNLKQIAELIISGSDTEVYYVTLSGFDTHANQRVQQERLLKAYAEGVHAFVKDLKANAKWNATLVMTFSEFGRRVKENGSRGTDHGAANNLYLMGGSLKKAGFYNSAPDLKNLHGGDLAYRVDFRRVYADVLKSWLKVDDKNILGGKFSPLGIV